jgi:hypothetical protein
MVVLTKQLALCATELQSPQLLALAGHVVHLQLNLPGAPTMQLLGVYMPANNAVLAARVRTYISATCSAASSAGQHFLVGGDVNAALLPEDRRGAPTAADLSWRALALASGLRTAPSAGARLHTFHGHNGSSSRIDDFLSDASLSQHCVQSLVAGNFNSDHTALRLEIALDSLGAVLPLPAPPAAPKDSFSKPFVKRELVEYHDAATAKLDPAFCALHAALRASASDPAAIDNVAGRIEPLLAELLQVAKDTCALLPAAAPPNTPNRTCDAIRAAVRAAQALAEALPPDFLREFPSLADPTAPGWAAQVHEHLKVARTAATRVVQTHKRTTARRATAKFSLMMKTNHKQAYRQIHGDKPVLLQALRDGPNMLTEPADILPAAAAQYAATPTPAVISADPTPPWLPSHADQLTSPLDPYTPAVVQVPASHARLFDRYDAQVFHEAIDSMANNKAAGPDDIPNELLRYAPDTFKDLLCDLFGACLRAAHCPAIWKHSVTSCYTRTATRHS